tara:strand:- start:87 stop:464 length:378 start_codon:yes stop_codon:yes gene_type:complete
MAVSRTRSLDENVKVTSNDTTSDLLLAKLSAGVGITLTELNDGGNEQVEISGTSAFWTEDEFTPGLGQVSFILTSAPVDPDSFSLHVNGVVYDDVVDYTVSGVTLTWLNTLFSLDGSDKLLARYQ